MKFTGQKASDQDLENIYSKHFSTNAAINLLVKLRKATKDKPKFISGPIGAIIVILANLLNALDNPTIPQKFKLTIMGALGYIILPLDLIPDAFIGIGFLDDLASVASIFRIVLKFSDVSLEDIDDFIDKKGIYSTDLIVHSEPQKGDVIYVGRLFYFHYGIYAGNNRVIHFSAADLEKEKKGEKVCEINPFNADIKETDLPHFIKKGELRVEAELPNPPAHFTPEEVVSRAESALGNYKGKYNLAIKNCEHFAHWAKYDIKECHQVHKVAKFLALIPVVGRIVLPVELYNEYNEKKRNTTF